MVGETEVRPLPPPTPFLYLAKHKKFRPHGLKNDELNGGPEPEEEEKTGAGQHQQQNGYQLCLTPPSSATDDDFAPPPSKKLGVYSPTHPFKEELNGVDGKVGVYSPSTNPLKIDEEKEEELSNGSPPALVPSFRVANFARHAHLSQEALPPPPPPPPPPPGPAPFPVPPLSAYQNLLSRAATLERVSASHRHAPLPSVISGYNPSRIPPLGFKLNPALFLGTHPRLHHPHHGGHAPHHNSLTFPPSHQHHPAHGVPLVIAPRLPEGTTLTPVDDASSSSCSTTSDATPPPNPGGSGHQASSRKRKKSEDIPEWVKVESIDEFKQLVEIHSQDDKQKAEFTEMRRKIKNRDAAQRSRKKRIDGAKELLEEKAQLVVDTLNMEEILKEKNCLLSEKMEEYERLSEMHRQRLEQRRHSELQAARRPTTNS